MPTRYRIPLANDRDQLSLNAQGLVAQSAVRQAFEGSSALVSQAVYYNLVGLRGGDQITKVVVYVNVAGSSMSNAKVAIYDTQASATLLASSADVANAFTATGFIETPLSSTYQVPADGAYYLAIWTVAGTPPQILRQAIANNFHTSALTGGKVITGAQTGQASLPSPGTISANSTASIWIGAMGTAAVP